MRNSIGFFFPLTLYTEKSCLSELNQRVKTNSIKSPLCCLRNLYNEWRWSRFLCTVRGKEKVPRTVHAVNVFISEPHRTLPERQLAGRSETGQLLSWLSPASLQEFHSQGLAFQPCLHPCPFQFYLFWFLAETFWEFLNSRDPVSLLSRNYICAELVRNETSSNTWEWGRDGVPTDLHVMGVFC